MANIYIYTGLSGSGKTTRLGDDSDNIIHLDELTKYFNKGIEPKNPYILQFVSMCGYYPVKPEDMNWEVDTYHIHNSFLYWLYNLKGITFHIEGIQFIKPYIDINFLSNKTLCIKIFDEFPIICLIRRIFRGLKSNKPNKLYRLFKYDLNPIHIKEVFQLMKFKKVLKNSKAVVKIIK